jgi:hypothetical protein
MHVFSWIVVGLIAGWATGKIMRGSGYGAPMDMVRRLHHARAGIQWTGWIDLHHCGRNRRRLPARVAIQACNQGERCSATGDAGNLRKVA